MKIPVYYYSIKNENEGIQAIAFVDEPAIMSNWVAFNHHKEKITFAIQDEEKQVVFGAVLIPDLPILRLDENGNPYYLVATKDVISQIADKFMKEQRTINFKMTHEDSSNVTEGVYATQVFIQDSANGIKPNGFDLPDGTLFMRVQVDNPNVWNDVKNKVYQAFSLEGFFDINPEPISLDESQIQTIIDSIV